MIAPLRPGNPLRLYDPLALPPREAASARIEHQPLGNHEAVLAVRQGTGHIRLRVDRNMAELLRDQLLLRHRTALRGSVATIGDCDGRDVVLHLNGHMWLEASDGTVITLDEAAILEIARVTRLVIRDRLPGELVA